MLDRLENFKRLGHIIDYQFIPLTDLGYDEEGDRLVITTKQDLTIANYVESLLKKYDLFMEYREFGFGICEMGFEC